MMATLNCLEPTERQNQFVLCMSRLSSFEDIQSMSNENLHKEKLSLHGTLILQLILDFNKPIKIVNSILSMEVEDLKNLFSNSMGSHIVDSYVKSSFVGEKSREKLIKKLQVRIKFNLSKICIPLVLCTFILPTLFFAGYLSRFSSNEIWFSHI